MMAKADKQRLDALLVAKGLCESRALAQRLIRAGEVKVNQQLVDKPGTLVTIDAAVELAQRPPYVSRGGEKLAKALTEFAIDVTGRICLDGGISTGGFTDCLLKRGATKVYGVDVGYGQVAWKLRQDDRVVLRERANFRYLTPQDLYGDQPWPNLGVMDLSFISLTKVMAPLWLLLAPPREVVLLVKPQFEVGREKIGKKGVVRDAQAQAEAIDQVWRSGQSLGWQFNGLTFSPITGPAGNVEYLLWLSQSAVNASAPTLTQLGEITQKTLDSFKG